LGYFLIKKEHARFINLFGSPADTSLKMAGGHHLEIVILTKISVE
jgi:hypothetical protein